MKNKEIKDLLLKEGFRDVGGDDDGTMYDSGHITFFLYKKKVGGSISFGHSEDGYYSIQNATLEQLKNIISIFKSAQFVGE